MTTMMITSNKNYHKCKPNRNSTRLNSTSLRVKGRLLRPNLDLSLRSFQSSIDASIQAMPPVEDEQPKSSNHNENSSIEEHSSIDDNSRDHQSSAPFSSPTKKSKKETIAHGLLFGFSALYILLFGGAFWGWGPMQLMLQEHGSYSSLCHDNGFSTSNTTASMLLPKESCPAQNAKLLNV